MDEEYSDLSDLESDDSDNYLIQDVDCTLFLSAVLPQFAHGEGVLRSIKELPSCTECQEGGAADLCRFKCTFDSLLFFTIAVIPPLVTGLRRVSSRMPLVQDFMGGRYTKFTQLGTEKPDFIYRRVFFPRISIDHIKLLQVCPSS